MKRILISSIVFVALGLSTISRAPEARPKKGSEMVGYYRRIAQKKTKLGFAKSLHQGARMGVAAGTGGIMATGVWTA